DEPDRRAVVRRQVGAAAPRERNAQLDDLARAQVVPEGSERRGPPAAAVVDRELALAPRLPVGRAADLERDGPVPARVGRGERDQEVGERLDRRTVDLL